MYYVDFLINLLYNGLLVEIFSTELSEINSSWNC